MVMSSPISFSGISLQHSNAECRRKSARATGAARCYTREASDQKLVAASNCTTDFTIDTGKLSMVIRRFPECRML
jgi:hypothetical protein